MSAEIPSPSIARRHDLDALRAIAMLLGVVLHAALAFIPGSGLYWAVEDSQATASVSVMNDFVHGFRMPLFFLISGFFTAMLWRKRGLGATIKQRLLRIALPLFIGLFTIIPAVGISYGVIKSWGSQEVASTDQAESGKDIVKTDTGISDADQFNLAAARGDIESMSGLLERGQDINALDSQGGAPLTTAAFFGRAETVEWLLQNGASIDQETARGESLEDILGSDLGAAQWIGGMIGVEVDAEEFYAGRKQIAELVGFEGEGRLTEEERFAQGIYFWLFQYPLWNHLWFLWFLCWMMVGASIIMVSARESLVVFAKRYYQTTVLFLVALTLTTAFEFWMDRQQPETFGPATSIAFLPMLSVLMYYFVFFAVGILAFLDSGGAIRPNSRWLAMMIIGCVLFLFKDSVGQIDGLAGEMAYALLQAVFAWCLVYGSMGLFTTYLRTESKVLRYISDSSYWIYLVHIPFVFYVQWWVRDWQLNVGLKLVFVCAATFFPLLLSYAIFVRHTPIGWLLNGRKKRRSVADPIAARV
ncbi:MAG: acyltransferase family protein [Planctomycetota bacterium]